MTLPNTSPLGGSDASTYLATNSSSLPENSHISTLLNCPYVPDPITSHVTLPHHHLSISLTPSDSGEVRGAHFNPTFLRLPSWATKSQSAKGAKYVLVARKVTEGLHQESLICLADICLPQATDAADSNGSTVNSRRAALPPDTRACTTDDLNMLGVKGGMRCTTPPMRLNVPPTPALRCSGAWANFPHIAGFHDPRIFWSNRGEPLIILNSASQYGCIGLWLLDLRAVYEPLADVLSRDGKKKAWELPTIAYKDVTELTRMGRSEVEKNWMLFFPGDEGEVVVQYDTVPSYHFDEHGLNTTSYGNRTGSGASEAKGNATVMTTGGRSLSRLLSHGITTPNITSPAEQTCFPTNTLFDQTGKMGHWHQSTNALKLILCIRQDAKDGKCGKPEDWPTSGREVHFSIMHRKFSNEWKLPMRYERWVVVWEGRKPYRVLGVSKHPFLFKGEKATGLGKTRAGVHDRLDSERSVRNKTFPEMAAPVEENGSMPNVSNWTTPYESFSGMKHLFRRQIDTSPTSTPQPEFHSLHTSDPQSADSSLEPAAYFTYYPSLSWVWQPTADHFSSIVQEGEEDVDELEHRGRGFLDDGVLVGIGLDDKEQKFVRVPVKELVGCLRLCEDKGA